MSVAAVEPRQSHPPGVGRLGVLDRLGPGTVGILLGIAAWEILGRVWNQPFFPPISRVLTVLVGKTASGEILGALASSLVNLAIGFTIAAAVGVGLGMLMGAYRKVEMALDAYVYALLTAPSLVFAPVFFSILGSGGSRLTVIGVVVMYAMFIIIVNTTAAIRNVDPALVEMGRSFCARDRQLFFRIVLPAALPLIMAGLRLGMGRAVKGMINGEMFVTIISASLGGKVIAAGQRFDAASVLAILIVIIVVAMVAVKVVQAVDLRLTGWLPSTARQRKRA